MAAILKMDTVGNGDPAPSLFRTCYVFLWIPSTLFLTDCDLCPKRHFPAHPGRFIPCSGKTMERPCRREKNHHKKRNKYGGYEPMVNHGESEKSYVYYINLYKLMPFRYSPLLPQFYHVLPVEILQTTNSFASLPGGT